MKILPTNIIALILFLLTISSEARLTDNKTKTHLENKNIFIAISEGFHLNTEAPAKLILLPNHVVVTPKSKDKHSLSYELPELKNQFFEIHYFVCDDGNTACEQHTESYKIEESKLIAITSKPSEETGQIQKIEPESYINKNGFYTNFSSALEIAKKENKLLFVDFSATWCPACLRLESEVFNQKEFQLKTKNIIKVSLDFDASSTQDYLKRYQIHVIPTMIIMNADASELLRIVDFKTTKELLTEINFIHHKKKALVNVESYLLKAQSGNKLAIKHLADRAYEMFDFESADHWYQKLDKPSLFSTSAHLKVLEKTNSPEREVALKQAIEHYPNSLDSLFWRADLAKILMENKTDQKVISELMTPNLNLIKKAFAKKSFFTKLFKETAQGLFTSFENIELLNHLEETLILMNEKKQAEDELIKLQNTLKAMPLNINNPGIVLMAIDYMKEAKMTVEVEKLYLALINTFPESDLYLRKLSRFYFQNKELSKALPLAKQATNKTSHFSLLNYILLAQIQKELHLNTELEQTIKEALDSKEALLKENSKHVEELNKLKTK